MTPLLTLEYKRRYDLGALGRNGEAGVASVVELADRDAIFAANDALAIGLLAGLREARRRVPEDVGVVGLGNLEIGGLITPSLSTVRIDGEAIGRNAGRLTVSQEGARCIDLGFALLIRHTVKIGQLASLRRVVGDEAN